MSRRRAIVTRFSVAAWISFSLVILMGLMAVPALFAEDEPEARCTLGTVRGLYIFRGNGYIISDTGHLPNAVVAFLSLNGDGTFTSLATANFNGTVVAKKAHDTGHYTVSEDCTGTLGSDGQGPHFDIYVSPTGTTFHMIQTDPSQVGVGEAKRVSRTPSR